MARCRGGLRERRRGPALPRSVHRAGRCCIRELCYSVANPPPHRDTVVIPFCRELGDTRRTFLVGVLAVALEHQGRRPPDVDVRDHRTNSLRAHDPEKTTQDAGSAREDTSEGRGMPPILTAEDVVKRIAAECALVDDRGAVGIRLKPAAAIVRQYGEQFRVAPRRRRGRGPPKPTPLF